MGQKLCIHWVNLEGVESGKIRGGREAKKNGEI